MLDRSLPLASLAVLTLCLTGNGSPRAPLPAAVITGEGWTELTLDDFVNVNGTDETWQQVDDRIVCTGRPIGGARSKQVYRNFEMVVEWKHETFAGNSGVFVWCPESAFTDLPPGTLPRSGWSHGTGAARLGVRR